jgi:hypothetical protein
MAIFIAIGLHVFDACSTCAGGCLCATKPEDCEPGCKPTTTNGHFVCNNPGFPTLLCSVSQGVIGPPGTATDAGDIQDCFTGEMCLQEADAGWACINGDGIIDGG